uniref:Uncharacterized protein n=1 Tax=Vespula pensylvanica TaxID=30213 RepID=A0A834P5L5_VESPE|nr:hypothetical protein H0235_005795 [Vespula pensylvanica]
MTVIAALINADTAARRQPVTPLGFNAILSGVALRIVAVGGCIAYVPTTLLRGFVAPLPFVIRYPLYVFEDEYMDDDDNDDDDDDDDDTNALTTMPRSITCRVAFHFFPSSSAIFAFQYMLDSKRCLKKVVNVWLSTTSLGRLGS